MPAQNKRPRDRQHGEHETNEPDNDYRGDLLAFLTTLNHQQRRLYAAVESNRIGLGGVKHVASLTGLCIPTISRGRRELADLVQGKPIEEKQNRSPGRPRTEAKHPSIVATLEQLLDDEVAGSPQEACKWVRSSTRKLATRLREQGFTVCYHTVWRILRDMGFSLKTAIRRRRGVTRDPQQRDEQFNYISSQRRLFGDAVLPVISVDTKKKELVGRFRRPGRSWCKQAPEVHEHDFASQAEGVAVPFGVYDVGLNRGYVALGMSHDTPEFAVCVIAKWWQEEGLLSYPDRDQLLILADAGGANGCKLGAWRKYLQERLCDRFGLTVTVCHYPPGCSKWNPVERRLFSEISKNWEGKSLKSFELILGYIRGTTTTTGLAVKAYLDEGTYRKGQKVTKEQMRKLAIEPHSVCPHLNYTIAPRPNPSPDNSNPLDM